MFGKLGDMMGKLHEMKQRTEEIKVALDAKQIEVSGAGGDVRITITGNRQLKKLNIAAALQHGDKERLEQELLTTLNMAIEKADKVNEEEMKKAATGLLPGL